MSVFRLLCLASSPAVLKKNLLLVSLLGLTLMTCGVPQAEAASTAETPRTAPALRIVYAANSQGHLFPCPT